MSLLLYFTTYLVWLTLTFAFVFGDAFTVMPDGNIRGTLATESTDVKTVRMRSLARAWADMLAFLPHASSTAF